jgi:AcrR family transcriptional regulator
MAGGRERQKRRTKAILLQAAAQLVREGKTPTVTEVADAAEVSRRTAYRYFPAQQQMLSEAALEGLRPQVERAIAKGFREGAVEEAIDGMVREVQRLALENEDLLRTMLRLSLDRKLGGQTSKTADPVRGARRIGWIESALASVRPQLGKARYERLVSAMALCLGIEALTVLRDYRGLRGNRAVAISRWAARALLDAAMREAKSEE